MIDMRFYEPPAGPNIGWAFSDQPLEYFTRDIYRRGCCFFEQQAVIQRPMANRTGLSVMARLTSLHRALGQHLSAASGAAISAYPVQRRNWTLITPGFEADFNGLYALAIGYAADQAADLSGADGLRPQRPDSVAEPG